MAPTEILALGRIVDELNYYQLLHLKEGAPAAEVKRAYYASSRTFHPDANRNLAPELRAAVERIAKRVTEAYSILRDPRRRQAYDDKLSASHGIRMPLAEAEAEAARRNQQRDLARNRPNRECHEAEDREDEQDVQQDHAGGARETLDQGQDRLVTPAGIDVGVVGNGIGERIVLRPAVPGQDVVARRQVEPDVRAGNLPQREQADRDDHQSEGDPLSPEQAVRLHPTAACAGRRSADRRPCRSCGLRLSGPAISNRHR